MKFWSWKLQKLKFKNLLEGFKDNFEQAEERICKLKYRTMEIIKAEEKKKKKNEEKWTQPKRNRDTIKRTNICIMGVLEEVEDKWTERILEEMMTGNFSN